MTAPEFNVTVSLFNARLCQGENTVSLYCILLYVGFCEWMLLGNWSAVKRSNMVGVLGMIMD